ERGKEQQYDGQCEQVLARRGIEDGREAGHKTDDGNGAEFSCESGHADGETHEAPVVRLEIIGRQAAPYRLSGHVHIHQIWRGEEAIKTGYFTEQAPIGTAGNERGDG